MPPPEPRITMDVSAAPIVVVTVRDGPVDADWVRMFDDYDRLYERSEPFCSIILGTGPRTAPNAAQRRLIAAKINERTEQMRRLVVASAAVVDSAILRGVITAINWIAPPVYPFTVVATLREAIDVAAGALAARGVTIPPSARRRIEQLRAT